MASKAKGRLPIVLKLVRYRVRKPGVVHDEAKRAGLQLSHALAMLEKETGIPQQNVFGCDYGSRGDIPPFCHQSVTKDRVKRLLAQSLNNGVGWTQLTYRPFVQQAESYGGAHKPRYQMRVGFKVLADLLNQYGETGGATRYNGTGPAAEAYGRDFAAKSSVWRSRGF